MFKQLVVLFALALLVTTSPAAAQQLPTMEFPLPQKFREGKPDCAEVDLVGIFKKFDSTSVTVRPVWTSPGMPSQYKLHYYVNSQRIIDMVIDSATKAPARQLVGARLIDTLEVGPAFTFPHLPNTVDTLIVYVEPLGCSQSFSGGLYLIPEQEYPDVPKDTTTTT